MLNLLENLYPYKMAKITNAFLVNIADQPRFFALCNTKNFTMTLKFFESNFVFREQIIVVICGDCVSLHKIYKYTRKKMIKK